MYVIHETIKGSLLVLDDRCFSVKSEVILYMPFDVSKHYENQV